MPVRIVVGLQWGDEGKGKMVDRLAEDASAVARFSGGANAGHTVKTPAGRFALHQLPSGVLREGVLGIIGSGCVVDPGALLEEMENLEKAGVFLGDRLIVSGKAHLVHPAAKVTEALSESGGERRIGTTGRGIGPTYVDKFSRRGIRLEDISMPGRFAGAAEQRTESCIRESGLDESSASELREQTGLFIRAALSLARYTGDASYALSRILDGNGTVIAEGAQGTLLDPDHGTYPYVTCGQCVSGAACTSLGFGPGRVDQVTGVLKAYSSRVGEGPFPTEQANEMGDRIRQAGNEYGTTTGRPRRCGWLDGVLARYAVRLNGCDWLTITLLDVLSGFDTLQVCTRYELDPEQDLALFETGVRLGFHVPVYESLPGWKEDIRGETRWDSLPENARRYVLAVEKLAGAPVRAVSTGPERDHLIVRDL